MKYIINKAILYLNNTTKILRRKHEKATVE